MITVVLSNVTDVYKLYIDDIYIVSVCADSKSDAITIYKQSLN